MTGAGEAMSNEEQSQGRKSYSAPEMQVHGDVRAVTRARSNMGADDNGAKPNRRTEAP